MFNNSIQKIVVGNPQRGLYIIRMGTGLLFVMFGFFKLLGGASLLTFLGSQMGLFGITVFPLFWGVCAMLSELLGGLALITNRFIKYVIPFTMITMIVATIMHLSQGHAFESYSFPISLLIVLIGLYCSE